MCCRSLIADGIDRVLAHNTRFPFGLLIGDAGSIDDTREVVFDYAARFPDVTRLVISDQNVGMDASDDRTSRDCCGKFIAWLERDDYWHRSD